MHYGQTVILVHLLVLCGGEYYVVNLCSNYRIVGKLVDLLFLSIWQRKFGELMNWQISN